MRRGVCQYGTVLQLSDAVRHTAEALKGLTVRTAKSSTIFLCSQDLQYTDIEITRPTGGYIKPSAY